MIKNWFAQTKRAIGTSTTDILFENDTHGEVITCTSYLALVRIFGYLKYASHSNVLIRGQTKCHDNLTPSALRNTSSPNQYFVEDLEALLSLIRQDCSIDADEDQKPTTEPMLQHYGIRTRWLDVVDSLPHAIYFAIHGFTSSGVYIDPEPDTIAIQRDFGYLYFIDCAPDKALSPVRVLENGQVRECKGTWITSDGFMLCDLRRARPSTGLRPHAQHGYLCRGSFGNFDLWHSDDRRMMVRARVPRKDALDWIAGQCLKYTTMFPSTDQDTMYRNLLKPSVNITIDTWKRTANRSFDPGAILRYHGEGRRSP